MIWIEQAIHLGAAGLEPFGHLFSGDVFLAHGFGQQGRRLVDRRGIVSSSLLCFLVMLRGLGEKKAPGQHSGAFAKSDHAQKRKREEPFPSRKVTETTGPTISKRSKEAPESVH